MNQIVGPLWAHQVIQVHEHPWEANGGPAFPTIATLPDHVEVQFKGMTLRDYFAAKAMQGMLADPGFDPPPETAAQAAYGIADAMLKARESTPTP